MSHGCGDDFSQAIFPVIYPWSQFINGIVGDVNVEKPASCADHEGDLVWSSNHITWSRSRIIYYLWLADQ